MNREDYQHTLMMVAKWTRKRSLAETKVAQYMQKARHYELEAVHESNYRVWMPLHRGKTHCRDIYVIELDEAIICERLCKGVTIKNANKIKNIREKIVLRYWKLAEKINYTGKGVSAGHKVEREAYELIRKLRAGEKIEPTYYRGRSYEGKTTDTGAERQSVQTGDQGTEPSDSF